MEFRVASLKWEDDRFKVQGRIIVNAIFPLSRPEDLEASASYFCLSPVRICGKEREKQSQCRNIELKKITNESG
jgi:hypothetical protein